MPFGKGDVGIIYFSQSPTVENPWGFRRVPQIRDGKRMRVMFQRLSLGALALAAVLAVSMPVAGRAQYRGGGGHSSGGGHFSDGGGSFGSPRGFSGGHFDGTRGFRGGFEGRDHWGGRFRYGGPVYRGRGIGFSFGAPYFCGAPYYYYDDPGYYYYDPGDLHDPGNTYAPNYSTRPAPAPQTCSPGGYDQYGNWVPNPNCLNQQQPYPQQPNYYPNQAPPNGR
jgi:hypothetical protein